MTVTRCQLDPKVLLPGLSIKCRPARYPHYYDADHHDHHYYEDDHYDDDDDDHDDSDDDDLVVSMIIHILKRMRGSQQSSVGL